MPKQQPLLSSLPSVVVAIANVPMVITVPKEYVLSALPAAQAQPAEMESGVLLKTFVYSLTQSARSIRIAHPDTIATTTLVLLNLDVPSTTTVPTVITAPKENVLSALPAVQAQPARLESGVTIKTFVCILTLSAATTQTVHLDTTATKTPVLFNLVPPTVIVPTDTLVTKGTAFLPQLHVRQPLPHARQPQPRVRQPQPNARQP